MLSHKLLSLVERAMRLDVYKEASIGAGMTVEQSTRHSTCLKR
jgi:hypothetical protein